MIGSFLGDRVSVLHFEGITDERGELVPVDFGELDFTPVRSFVVTAPGGTLRGGHAHRHGTQLLVRVSGVIQIDLALDGEQHRIELTEAQNALLVRAPVWFSQTYLGQSPAMIVFSDQPYDPDSYITDE